MQCVGTKPGGAPWRIGVQDPDRPDGILGVIDLPPGRAVFMAFCQPSVVPVASTVSSSGSMVLPAISSAV